MPRDPFTGEQRFVRIGERLVDDEVVGWMRDRGFFYVIRECDRQPQFIRPESVDSVTFNYGRAVITIRGGSQIEVEESVEDVAWLIAGGWRGLGGEDWKHLDPRYEIVSDKQE